MRGVGPFSSARRGFLEDSMFATAAALAAGSLATRAYAQAEKPAGPNDVVRIAVLGVNGRGGNHLQGYMSHPGAEVVAIVDPDEAIGKKKGVEYVTKKTGKKPQYYADIRKMLENQEIDAISVATPNHWHSLAGIWALQHGKHAYVEKPISHNVLEGRRLVQAQEKHPDLLVACGTQSRSHVALQEFKAYLDQGGIGEVKLARGLCYKPRGPIGERGIYQPPASVDYDIWSGPAPMEPLTRPNFHYDWHWQWTAGNGDIGNQGIHQMDLARWGLGVETLCTSVSSFGGRLGYLDAGDTANTLVSLFDFDEGRRIIFETRGLKTPDLKGAKIGVIFYGSDGYGVMTSNYGSAVCFNPDGSVQKEFKGGGDHFAVFVDAVRAGDRRKLTADALGGHLSSALCHLGNVSYRLGKNTDWDAVRASLQGDEEGLETATRTVEHCQENGVDYAATPLTLGPKLAFDPVRETFTGSLASTANPHLGREYRRGFELPTETEV